MTQAIDSLLIEAEGRYLTPAALDQLKIYVKGWPERRSAYQRLRSLEKTLVLATLKDLQQESPDLSPRVQELCQRDLVLALRHSTLAMLLQEEDLLQERLIDWMEEQVRLYDLQGTYTTLYRLLQQNLKQQLSSSDLELIRPYITQVQVALIF